VAILKREIRKEIRGLIIQLEFFATGCVVAGAALRAQWVLAANDFLFF